MEGWKFSVIHPNNPLYSFQWNWKPLLFPRKTPLRMKLLKVCSAFRFLRVTKPSFSDEYHAKALRTKFCYRNDICMPSILNNVHWWFHSAQLHRQKENMHSIQGTIYLCMDHKYVLFQSFTTLAKSYSNAFIIFPCTLHCIRVDNAISKQARSCTTAYNFMF